MTSKALEAAYDEAVGMGLMIDSPAEIARIIRAFAQNLSDKAADIVGVDIHERDQRGFEVFTTYEKIGVLYRAIGRNLMTYAIEKDLE